MATQATPVPDEGLDDSTAIEMLRACADIDNRAGKDAEVRGAKEQPCAPTKPVPSAPPSPAKPPAKRVGQGTISAYFGKRLQPGAATVAPGRDSGSKKTRSRDDEKEAIDRAMKEKEELEAASAEEDGGRADSPAKASDAEEEEEEEEEEERSEERRRRRGSRSKAKRLRRRHDDELPSDPRALRELCDAALAKLDEEEAKLLQLQAKVELQEGVVSKATEWLDKIEARIDVCGGTGGFVHEAAEEAGSDEDRREEEATAAFLRKEGLAPGGAGGAGQTAKEKEEDEDDAVNWTWPESSSDIHVLDNSAEAVRSVWGLLSEQTHSQLAQEQRFREKVVAFFEKQKLRILQYACWNDGLQNKLLFSSGGRKVNVEWDLERRVFRQWFEGDDLSRMTYGDIPKVGADVRREWRRYIGRDGSIEKGLKEGAAYEPKSSPFGYVIVQADVLSRASGQQGLCALLKSAAKRRCEAIRDGRKDLQRMADGTSS